MLFAEYLEWQRDKAMHVDLHKIEIDGQNIVIRTQDNSKNITNQNRKLSEIYAAKLLLISRALSTIEIMEIEKNNDLDWQLKKFFNKQFETLENIQDNLNIDIETNDKFSKKLYYISQKSDYSLVKFLKKIISKKLNIN